MNVKKIRKCLCCDRDCYIISNRDLKSGTKTTVKHVDKGIKNHHWLTLYPDNMLSKIASEALQKIAGYKGGESK